MRADRRIVKRKIEGTEHGRKGGNGGQAWDGRLGTELDFQSWIFRASAAKKQRWQLSVLFLLIEGPLFNEIGAFLNCVQNFGIDDN